MKRKRVLRAYKCCKKPVNLPPSGENSAGPWRSSKKIISSQKCTSY